ncbi:hypothetical protein [Candidatus Trichorickettsia mobilis]|uniref:hypothetical protein n=1 Tax=Candidatus Trichorickettsia mobilis TaxID=1346319 RepID=UPI002B25C0CF|nr:hypothetical protein [Candidatus Trichorickettsia mobilis]
MLKVGIDAIEFYTPNYYLDLKLLAEARAIDVNKFHIGLGQEKMAVSPPDEDIVTMGAEAGSRVLKHVDPTEKSTCYFLLLKAVSISLKQLVFLYITYYNYHLVVE